MNTNDRLINVEDELLRCDSSKCMQFKHGNWEDRFEDLIFGVGP